MGTKGYFDEKHNAYAHGSSTSKPIEKEHSESSYGTSGYCTKTSCSIGASVQNGTNIGYEEHCNTSSGWATSISEGTSNPYYINSDKPHCSSQNTVIKAKNDGHSFVYALSKPGALYIAVDSFAVQEESSADKQYTKETIIQNYKKLAMFGKEENPTIIISSEKNGSKTLTELASGTTTDYFNLHNEEDYLTFRFENENCKFRKPIYGYWADFKTDTSMYIGESVLTKLADSFVKINSTNEKDIVDYINRLYKAIIAVSELTVNSVGGPIHIGKLTPKGFFWLQNGYEL